MQRTQIIDTSSKIGNKVILYGWAQNIRDHGGIVFLDLRDRSGMVQVVLAKKMDRIENEAVVKVEGVVKKRPKSMINKNIGTGEIEIYVEKITKLSSSQELPFPITGSGYDINEDIRMKYRYLDIRRERMLRNLVIRSRTVAFIRNFLIKEGFIEIETPILTKTTPEGARDFIVPSRLQKGKFYALPQSPQQYKQLLMVAGIEKYFQIARCFRDEDPRADRAYGEFTQLDMEMSFVDQNDILRLTEKLFTEIVNKIFPEKKITKTPWPRITYREAINMYKTDKPDLRKDKKNPNELAFAWIVDFPLFVKQTEDDYFYGLGSAKYAPSHHMFTSPHPEDIPLLDNDPLRVRGLQHDMVLNGFEVGGGSVRIHRPEIQNKVFDLIGFTNEQKEQFKHLLEAFRYGVPPHGGIAPGLDRFLMVVLGEPSLREVIAFPTSSSGKTSVLDAPSSATASQLKELGIKVIKKT